MTDAQWEIVEPMLPLIKSPGRVPKHPRSNRQRDLVFGPWRLFVA
ncbi:transposase [Actinoplanes campanulatus]|nr:transposase [Actinoplanes capillaceus]